MGADLYTQDTYFRDSYNESSLMWKYDLSWWVDIDQHTDEDVLKEEGIRWLLEEMTNREEMFQNSIKDMDAEAKEEILKRNEDFRDFLTDALEKGENIRCSI